MKATAFRIPLLIAALSNAATITLQAAPSLPITEPPVTSSAQDGPPADPWSTNGQWFLSNDGLEEFRTHEFYDNDMGAGGGIAGSRAIYGVVTHVTLDGSGTFGIDNIIAFEVLATITNDTPSTEGEWAAGDNSHGEALQTSDYYIGTMRDTKLTAEFAIADINNLPSNFVAPYRPTDPFIIAEEEDQAGWYCWTQEDLPDYPGGGYYVPTWDFGDIPTNQSVSRTLKFALSGPLTAMEGRYYAIQTSYENGEDVFANRSSSLKISTWIDDIGVDFPGPEGMFRNSDVSVFHDTEEEFEEESDFGDAPDTGPGTSTGNYETLLADNGAFHPIVPGAPYFDDASQSDQPDPEPDGQQDPNAMGDDNDGNDDEDGVVFTPLFAGFSGSVTVTVAVGGYVDAWIDFNANGSWLDPGELIHSGPMAPGANAVNINVPASAVPGQTFARFRISSATTAHLPTGGAQDGEVEDHAVTIIQETIDEYDFGDAPDTGQGTSAGNYETLLNDNGAYHNVVPGAPYFDDGTQTDQPDLESNGQPTANADGDDLDAQGDDEDGIIFPPLAMGQPGYVSITVDDGGSGTGGGYVDAWIDFNSDGDWVDPGEQIYSAWMPQGLNNIGFTVPIGSFGQTFARFRINSQAAGLPPTGGPAVDGEVEDHPLYIEEEAAIDWGDIVDSGNYPAFTYRTLSSNGGANHLIVSGILMGNSIDPETDGQPNATATGDDNDGNDDEDGVIFQSLLIPGQQALIDVTVSVSGWLDIWIDADKSWDWTGPNDLIFSGNVVAGLNQLSITLPTGIPSGQNYMRFRYNTLGALPYSGGAANGEVEDYLVTIEELDWGDAPVGFNTVAANSGANHTIVPGIFLGSQIDPEPDGQPGPAAFGDDSTGLADEDGVTFNTPIIPGQLAQVDVVASTGGRLDVWLDVDNSGSWTGPDYVWNGFINSGLNQLQIQVPYNAVPNQSSYIRFRYTLGGTPLPPTGWAADGEVEDYQVVIEPPELDWGDAPNTYPTMSANSGATHIITTGVMLGAAPVDPEPDGQPSANALGDDSDGNDDEDGVTFVGNIVAGSNATVNITAGSTGGKIDAWIDFNADGDWADSGEQILTSQSVSPGVNGFTFSVPQPSALGETMARFRISTAGGLPADNAGISTPDGEVEDHLVELYQPQMSTNLVITNFYFTASNAIANVEWNAEAFITYQLQLSTNLVVSNWVDVGTTILGPLNLQTNGVVYTNQFYRMTAPWTAP